MSHMGPPGVDIAAARTGAITRASAARNFAEAQLNLEAQRAATAAEEGRDALVAKDVEIVELEKELKAKRAERNTLAVTVAGLDEERNEAQAKARQLSEELDKVNDQLMESNAARAAAELSAQEAIEAKVEEEKAKKEAQFQARLETVKAEHYRQQALNSYATKRKLTEFLTDSANRDVSNEFDFSLQTHHVGQMLSNGDAAAANEALEHLERALIVYNRAGSSNEAGSSSGSS
eukprot:CAMPEP_0174754584 /NCGR_PEP_ID=MMETSP1094-20130205/105809_1 /TAXON_ID=156173 /ORGANISM="Chrysochromulina brevifilum, Strain UTEX LB 985" /LENGTH=233 /DNA_ID=CAMNT_0015960455 /DNA_START=253 /DNA_END=954 /DNA_ORIENTATION=+